MAAGKDCLSNTALCYSAIRLVCQQFICHKAAMLQNPEKGALSQNPSKRYQMNLYITCLARSLARLFSMKVPISPHNTYDYATLATALQMNCVRKGRLSLMDMLLFIQYNALLL